MEFQLKFSAPKCLLQPPQHPVAACHCIPDPPRTARGAMHDQALEDPPHRAPRGVVKRGDLRDVLASAAPRRAEPWRPRPGRRSLLPRLHAASRRLKAPPMPRARVLKSAERLHGALRVAADELRRVEDKDARGAADRFKPAQCGVGLVEDIPVHGDSWAGRARRRALLEH